MKRGTKLLYKKIFAGLLGGGMLFMPNWSYALPSGGQVVTNNGTITAGGQGDGYNRQRQCGDRLEQF